MTEPSSDTGAGPVGFDAIYEKILGIGEAFSVKSHYPGRKAAEHELVQSEARFRTMFEAVPFDMYFMDNDGAYALGNAAFIRSFGDILGKRPESVISQPSIRESYLEDYRKTESGQTVSRTLEIDSADDVRYVLAIMAPVIIDGEKAGTVGVNIDITEQKRAENALRQLNLDLEKKIAERTESLELALRELKAAQDDLVKSRFQASVGRVLASIAHELNSPLASTASAAGYLSAMSEEAADALVKMLSLPGGLAGIAVALLSKRGDAPRVDRAKRRALAARLAAAGCASPDSVADDLADLDAWDLSDEDISSIAGDGGAEAVACAWTLASLFGSAALAAKSALRAAGVVRSLNAYLELSEDYSAAAVEFDLSARLRTIEEELAAEASASLTVRLEDGLMAFGDPDRLDLVWGHLMENALYAAGKNGSVEVSAALADGKVEVSIMDSGQGIDPSIIAKIFEPLFTTKGSGEGKGLGLDMCRKIIDSHRGTIAVESVPGRTVFTVTLPGRHDGAAIR